MSIFEKSVQSVQSVVPSRLNGKTCSIYFFLHYSRNFISKMRIRKLVLWVVLGGFSLFLSGIIFFVFFLPGLIESSVLPKVFQKTGIQVACDVRRIGITGADLGGLRIGDANKPPVSIGSSQLD